MSAVENQRRVLGELLRRLHPHWRRDFGLPERIELLLRWDRRFGARDRRLYRELVYAAIRHLPWIETALEIAPEAACDAIGWLAADTPATHLFRVRCGFGPAPAPGRVAERADVLAPTLGAAARAPLLPAWFEGECPEAFSPPDYDALNMRAPLWLRLQTTEPDPVFAEFGALGWKWRTAADLPTAIELLGEADVSATEAYRRGAIEVQDIGSQLILAAAGIAPSGRWLDACAGAGGKSLQLAGLLGAAGRVDACDIRPGALAELGRRTARAGLGERISRRRTPDRDYDGVLIDAPCSGSGTWRRSPHLKWVTGPDRVESCARTQRELLERYAPLARPGGRVIYATCSLCRTENEDVAADFLDAFPEFAAEPFAAPAVGEPRGAGLLFRPAAHNGDGFFAACFRRKGGRNLASP